LAAEHDSGILHANEESAEYVVKSTATRLAGVRTR
jgi:hypothetical protein